MFELNKFVTELFDDEKVIVVMAHGTGEVLYEGMCVNTPDELLDKRVIDFYDDGQCYAIEFEIEC